MLKFPQHARFGVSPTFKPHKPSEMVLLLDSLILVLAMALTLTQPLLLVNNGSSSASIRNLASALVEIVQTVRPETMIVLSTQAAYEQDLLSKEVPTQIVLVDKE